MTIYDNKKDKKAIPFYIDNLAEKWWNDNSYLWYFVSLLKFYNFMSPLAISICFDDTVLYFVFIVSRYLEVYAQ